MNPIESIIKTQKGYLGILKSYFGEESKELGQFKNRKTISDYSLILFQKQLYSIKVPYKKTN